MFNIECPICFEDLTEKKILTLHCKHKICFDCFKEWYKMKNTCPICRKPLRRVFKILFLDSKSKSRIKFFNKKTITIGFISLKEIIGIKYEKKKFIFEYNELKNMKILRNILILNFVKNSKKIQFKLHHQRYILNHIYNVIFNMCSL
jgi:hypothetical protein